MDEKVMLLLQNVAVIQSQHEEIRRRMDVLHAESVKRAEFDAVKETANGAAESITMALRALAGIVLTAVVGLALANNPLG